MLFFTGCTSKQWYKGNTHVHTLLCGHADSSPEAVTAWYHERGYNFLCLSEHNQFIDPATVEMPPNRREDFILIPGEEVTGGQMAHTTALNIDGLVDPRLQQPVGASKTRVIQAHVHGTEAENGRAILNHPNFHYMHTAADIRPVQGLHMFELYNGHPAVNNFGDHEHISVEQLWDQLLTDGMLIYGVSSDDAHKFQSLGSEHSNPGRGWVMVNAGKLTPDAITEAMYRGDFYATSGVMLRVAETSDQLISVEVDERSTESELASSFVMGHKVVGGIPGYSIQFIGTGGRVLDEIQGTAGEFSVDGQSDYVRAKVTYTREADTGFENFYAWMQPVFTDGRSHFVKEK
jgi:hypothetical protein